MNRASKSGVGSLGDQWLISILPLPHAMPMPSQFPTFEANLESLNLLPSEKTSSKPGIIITVARCQAVNNSHGTVKVMTTCSFPSLGPVSRPTHLSLGLVVIWHPILTGLPIPSLKNIHFWPPAVSRLGLSDHLPPSYAFFNNRCNFHQGSRGIPTRMKVYVVE